MNYDWYLIFNKDEFEELDLVSKTYSLDLEGIGTKDVLVTWGEKLGITYEGIFLPLELNDENPFEFESHAVYIDEDNDVYLGIATDEN